MFSRGYQGDSQRGVCKGRGFALVVRWLKGPNNARRKDWNAGMKWFFCRWTAMQGEQQKNAGIDRINVLKKIA